MDLEYEENSAEEVISFAESLPDQIINTDEETVIIHEVLQDLQSLVDVCLVQQKQVDACLQGAISLSSFKVIITTMVAYYCYGRIIFELFLTSENCVQNGCD